MGHTDFFKSRVKIIDPIFKKKLKEHISCEGKTYPVILLVVSFKPFQTKTWLDSSAQNNCPNICNLLGLLLHIVSDSSICRSDNGSLPPSKTAAIPPSCEVGPDSGCQSCTRSLLPWMCMLGAAQVKGPCFCLAAECGKITPVVG